MADSWRLITDASKSGAENMAVDEAMVRGLEYRVQALPTLRLYGWSAPTISIGYLQDAGPFKDAGIPVVRRMTGGRAVLHDAELTYGVAAPSAHRLFAGGIMDAYRVISACIASALNDVGIDAGLSERKSAGGKAANPACFYAPSRYEVLVDGRKLAGSSQRRFKDAFIQHGSILFGLDEGLNSRLFGKDAVEKAAWVRAYKEVDTAAFSEKLISRMAEGFNASFELSALNETEDCLRQSLLECKYSKDEWNLCGSEGTPTIKGI
ncbi:MAG: lipoate--protein ligase family protein [Deltaproteobacteria bacterium]|nr:lipoate--protein ligase family protein [Deltaproteobacteria bacterium]